MKLLNFVILSLVISVSAKADNSCLNDLTDSAAEAKRCQVSQSISESCDDEIRDVEIKRLTCLRDGAEPERVATAMQLGDLMVRGKATDSPANSWLERRVAELVNLRLDNLMQQSVEQQITKRLENMDSRVRSLESSLLQIGSDMEFQFSVERDERVKLSADFKTEIAKLRKPAKTDVDLERRLRGIEERIMALDAVRTSINAELLRVQGQINGILLDKSVK